MEKVKAVFLDRDGVINRYPGDREYVKSWDEFFFLPKVKTALKRLSDKGFRIFVISNQAGVGKGVYSKGALDLITQNMLREFSLDKISISGVYYCTHRQEDNCSCRKPKSGLIDMAVTQILKNGITLDRAKSYFIGDTILDMQAGESAGLTTILVFSGKERRDNKNNWKIQPDYTAGDLSEAADIILA
ncbi:MAG: HAD family hydrolase [Candidatus Omnitrophota bacterium]